MEIIVNEFGKDVEPVVEFQKAIIWLLVSTVCACGLVVESDHMRQCLGADTNKEIFDLHKHAWS